MNIQDSDLILDTGELAGATSGELAPLQLSPESMIAKQKEVEARLTNWVTSRHDGGNPVTARQVRDSFHKQYRAVGGEPNRLNEIINKAMITHNLGHPQLMTQLVVHQQLTDPTLNPPPPEIQNRLEHLEPSSVGLVACQPPAPVVLPPVVHLPP